MKFTINKEFTRLSEVDSVKSAIRDFKEIWTERDLLHAFESASEEIEKMGLSVKYDKILSCSVNVFPAGFAEDCQMHFDVEMDLKGWERFATIHFYINERGEIDTRDFDTVNRFNPQGKMYRIIEYGRTTEPLQ